MKTKKADYSKLKPDFIKSLDDLKSGSVNARIDRLQEATDRGFRAVGQEMKLSELTQADLNEKTTKAIGENKKALTELLERPEAKEADFTPIQKEIKKGFDKLSKEIAKKDYNPTINVESPDVIVPATEIPPFPEPVAPIVNVDTRKLEAIAKRMEKAVEQMAALEMPDMSGMEALLEKIAQNTLDTARRPIPLPNNGGGSGGGSSTPSSTYGSGTYGTAVYA